MNKPDRSEYEALRSEAALVESTAADWLRLTGEDRLRFANGLVTCDLRTLESGEGAYGFFTDARGKIVLDAAFLESDDALWVELPEGQGRFLAEHMRKYVVADRVEIEELRGWSSLRVAGPTSVERVAAVLGVETLPERWTGAARERETRRLVVRGERRAGVPAVVVAGSEASLAPEREVLLAELRSVEETAAEAVRVEEGIPLFSRDLMPGESGDRYFPQESGLEDWAVSYEKGCYLGQEVVARIHFRGKVNRSLRGVVFEPNDEPRRGTELTLADEVVGTVTSVVHSPRSKRPIGLAVVHHKAGTGAELSASGSSCVLAELPFGAA